MITYTVEVFIFVSRKNTIISILHALPVFSNNPRYLISNISNIDELEKVMKTREELKNCSIPEADLSGARGGRGACILPIICSHFEELKIVLSEV